jgi:hypothetical protein
MQQHSCVSMTSYQILTEKWHRFSALARQELQACNALPQLRWTKQIRSSTLPEHTSMRPSVSSLGRLVQLPQSNQWTYTRWSTSHMLSRSTLVQLQDQKITSKIKQHISHSALILRIDYLYHTLHLRTIILPKHVDQIWPLWFDVRTSPDTCLLIFYQSRQQFTTTEKHWNTLNFPTHTLDSILLNIGKQSIFIVSKTNIQSRILQHPWLGTKFWPRVTSVLCVSTARAATHCHN